MDVQTARIYVLRKEAKSDKLFGDFSTIGEVPTPSDMQSDYTSGYFKARDRDKRNRLRWNQARTGRK